MNCTMMQFKIQGLCSSFDCFVIYNSEGGETLCFYLHLHKIPPIIIARFYSCSSGLRKPRPFFSFSCSVFKIRIASFNYIIICTITKLMDAWTISKCMYLNQNYNANGLLFINNCCIEKWNVPYCLNLKYILFFMTWLNIIMGGYAHVHKIEILSFGWRYRTFFFVPWVSYSWNIRQLHIDTS